MSMNQDCRSSFTIWPKAVLITALAFVPHIPGWTADIDIYGPPTAGGAPNVVFLLDNTSNWSSNNQNWNSTDAWATCASVAVGNPRYASCQALKVLIDTVYYTGTTGKKRPWEL